jgi:hypothetical protein
MNRYSIILILFYSVLVFNCKSFKSINTYEIAYKGEIKIINEEKTNLKFKLYFDTLKTINIKLYSNAGFRVGSFNVYNDSISIIDLYDEKYKNLVNNIYSSINNEICLKEFLYNLFNKDILKEYNYVLKSNDCGNTLNNEVIGRNEITFYTKNCRKLFTVVENKAINITRNKKFVIKISKSSSIEISFKKI